MSRKAVVIEMSDGIDQSLRGVDGLRGTNGFEGMRSGNQGIILDPREVDSPITIDLTATQGPSARQVLVAPAGARAMSVIDERGNFQTNADLPSLQIFSGVERQVTVAARLVQNLSAQEAATTSVVITGFLGTLAQVVANAPMREVETFERHKVGGGLKGLLLGGEEKTRAVRIEEAQLPNASLEHLSAPISVVVGASEAHSVGAARASASATQNSATVNLATGGMVASDSYRSFTDGLFRKALSKVSQKHQPGVASGAASFMKAEKGSSFTKIGFSYRD